MSMFHMRTRHSDRSARQSSRLVLEALEDRRLLSFTVVDLGTFGGSNSIAYGLNESGQVVGNADGPNGIPHAFHWSSTEGLIELADLGGSQSNGFAINDDGVIVGLAQLPDPTKIHAVRWIDGVPLDLGTLGGPRSKAFSITADGRIVGEASINNDPPLLTEAFIWQDGAMTSLGTFPNGVFSSAQGINEAGQIVGFATPSTGNLQNAFLYEGGELINLGTLGGNDSKAYAINENGQIVGSSTLANGSRTSFLYVRNKMINIGGLGGLISEAFAINDNTHIVGTSLTASGEEHAFLWRGGFMFDLNTLYPDSGWTFEAARGINNKGQIVGVGMNPNLEPHAFLLTPDERGNVPPPRSFAIFTGAATPRHDTIIRQAPLARTSARAAAPVVERELKSPAGAKTAPIPAFRTDIHSTGNSERIDMHAWRDPLAL